MFWEVFGNVWACLGGVWGVLGDVLEGVLGMFLGVFWEYKKVIKHRYKSYKLLVAKHTINLL